MSNTSNISNLISGEKENKNINTNLVQSREEQIIKTQNQLTELYNIKEIKFLKDDIMNYFKQKFEEYSTKLDENISKITQIEKNFEIMTESININYNKIIKTQATMQSELDKLKNYDSFSKNVKDKLISHEIRLNNIREDFSKATQKYDKIYLDNLELPGFIGRCAKYKNCQIFFEDVIKNLATLNLFREKNIIDLKSYKEKLENIIKTFHILVDNNNQAQIKYINSQNEKNITDCKNMMKILEERIKDVKVDNAKYSMDIMKKTEEMHKKWDRIDKIKEEIFGEFNIKNDEIKKMNNDTIDKFNEFKKEYKIIRDKFFELADFIKDIRFQKNIKNIYSQILYRKNIKSICKSLNELNDIKNNSNKNDETDLELIKNISSIEKMNFKINKNNTFEQNFNLSQEIQHNNINDISKNKKNIIRKTVEYNSPLKINNKMSRNEKSSSIIKKYRTIDIQKQNINKDINSLTMNNFANNIKNVINTDINKEKEDFRNNNTNNSNYNKKKTNQKIIIESKLDLSILSTNKTLKKINANEDSNSLALDNQSTNYINSNNINKNDNINNNKDISFLSVSAFSLNCENKNNNNIKQIDNNDKIIKELASELEQSTAKKNLAVNIKEKEEKIEPKNLVKSDYKLNDNSPTYNSFNQNNINKNTISAYNSKSFHNLQNDIKSTSIMSNKEKNEFILYGNNPKAIDKKFFMTDKKLLDLEEYTKDKLKEIINQIDKLKTNNSENNNTVQLRTNKSNNILSFNSYKEKTTSLSNNNLNLKNEKKNNSSFMNNISNKIKYLNQKLNENKSDRKINENYKKDFDATSHNFKKRKFYNLEQISQKIINSSCKKIKTNSNDEKEKEKKMISPKAKEYIKKMYLSRNDINALEQKKSENNFFCEGKKWETIDNIKIKNIENKKQKNKNLSSENIYLTQKNGENNSFNENEIKLVYLNKFVNNKLPYAPSDTFLGEKN